MTGPATSVGSLRLEHPVLNASGTLDPLAAAAAGLPIHQDLAAITTKTVTPLAREGNPAPRIAEAPAGMLNSIGLANPGIDAFQRHVLPRLAALGRPLVVSVGGFAHDEYAQLCRRLDGEAAISALELNVSCPNVESGCISIGSDAAETRAVVARCRAATRLPLWVKLSPNVADVAAIARAAEEGGADALVLINTVRGIAVDRTTGRAVLGGPGGGLSGPAIKPVALAVVATCRAATSLPIVGTGGIAGGDDAWQFMQAGASAVAIGTALFREPALARRCRDELARLLAEWGVPGHPQRADQDASATRTVNESLSFQPGKPPTFTDSSPLAG
jgi:dihydroorotate dehydrogenase (NAD+) catalytic subunit